MGPRSRELLQPLVDIDLSNETFPFSTARTVEIGMAVARAHRVSYVGELGWEIYVSSDMARHVFDVVAERGDTMGLRLCGMHVLDSCRIEKAYRHYGHDISSEDNVLEAGLGFAVKPDKAVGCFGPFIGRDVVLRTKEAGLGRRLIQFRLEAPEPLLYHNEPILRNGRIVGRLTSGAYGHHFGAAIGLGYVPVDPGESNTSVLASRYSIEVAGERYAAMASLRPLYDPTSARVRA
jgi:glycine cleavage system aminomethyltransferase T